MQNNPTTLQGMVESIIYHNDDNGYTVFTIYCEDQPLTLLITRIKMTTKKP